MSDNLQTIVHFDGKRRYEATFIAISDGSGETLSTKVDIGQMTVRDDIRNVDVPVRELAIESIEYDCLGYERIELLWNTGEDNYIAMIPGGGGRDSGNTTLSPQASHGRLFYGDVGLIDPSGEGGSIELTSRGAVSGDTYSIKIRLRLKT